ncbi:protein phosphatase 2C domain-containing protein [Ureaplasma miroungigenitalium]|uniref:Protein phosphatase 2C domain-containing protein n=1 Tax=Ureaplasma miroungigenitalium TaxID=1042321 RepID=A0ABT3BLZ4_9BACT|nr:protein phosphatase 2C domain-containing protein [Ureaplasma miroungigenitalium]MCV3728266.1 protein phosphatase 2C domain-containing protein [Ureaplasma miroungigenitalium]MCV3734071.1 protein phosphatase 2C domain-containing protein [Ureaplasma miroungigenitalium]
MVKSNFLSDIGSHRDHNDDVATVVNNEFAQTLLIVCDGLGGYDGSSTASCIVLETIRDAFLQTDCANLKLNKNDEETQTTSTDLQARETNLRTWLIDLIHEAQKKITQQANIDTKAYHMATTLVLCIIIDKHAYIMNIGDSRAYLLKSNSYIQIGYDHNVLNRLKQMNADPSLFKKYEKNLYSLTQYIGRTSNVALTYDFYVQELLPNDIILLASDGFYPYYELTLLHDYLIKESDDKKIRDILLKTVLDNQSLDNISFAYYVNL